MSSVHEGFSITDTYGASYLGVIIAAGLYGLTTLQTYFYYVNYPEDRPGLKLFVYMIWLLDTLHIALVVYCMYYYVILNYNNPPALAIGHWTVFVSLAVNITIGVVVQCYFTQKIYAFCPKRFKGLVATFIGIFIFAHLTFGIETVVLLFIKKYFARLPEITFIAVMPFALTAMVAELLIATALCILLWGSKTSFRSTDTTISKLVTYAINRCLLASMVDLAILIACLVSPQTHWYLVLEFIIGKLYANSLLATLNSRHMIRDINNDTVNSVHLSRLGVQQSPTRLALSDVQRDQIQVNLQYETRIDEDQIMSGSKMV